MASIDFEYCGLDASYEIPGEYLLYKKIDVLEKKMDKIDVLEKKIDKIDELEKKMDKMEKKMDKVDVLEKKMDKMEKKMDRIEVEFKNLNEKIDEKFTQFFNYIKILHSNVNFQLLDVNNVNDINGANGVNGNNCDFGVNGNSQ